MHATWLPAAMFAAALGAVLLGYPVAFTLAGVGLCFAALGTLLGVMEPHLMSALPARIYGVMTNEMLVAVPLFVFMGVALERARLAEALLTTLGQLFGRMRGGLGLSVVLVGALLAASTGIVGATVVTMGLLSLPAMLRAGYCPRLSSGIVAAAGTLGQIIPPSTVLIFVAVMIQNANMTASFGAGQLAPTAVSVGAVFLGALLPGLLLVGAYIAYVLLRALVTPAACPALPPAPGGGALWRRVLWVLLPPLGLILSVLGSILSGIATPTEAASVGAVGALLLALCHGRLDLSLLRDIMRATLTISSMVFVILLGASVFSLVFRGLEGETMVADWLSGLPGGLAGATFAVMLVLFLLGFFLDTFEIIFILVPIAAPALIAQGLDPVWLAVAIGLNLQTSFLTPPFGFSLFYLRGVAPRAVSTGAIYRGALPFVALQLGLILLIWFRPDLATALPARAFAPPPAALDGGGVQDLLEEDLLLPEEAEDPFQ